MLAQSATSFLSTETQVGNPSYFWLMLFVFVAVAASLWAGIALRRARMSFGGVAGKAASGSTLKRFVAATMSMAGIVLISLALMDIRWGKTTYDVPQKGLEVIFALDVSRSMLAQDASPNRLARAKQQIKDMIDEMAGDRIGLVVFAGEADQAVPLTSHYEDFKTTLDSVGPHSVTVGGSQLGVAIAAAADGFISKTNEHKTIVLFTDGEDQESQPVKLAQQLYEQDGTRIFTIGLGDFEQGAKIPDSQNQSQSPDQSYVQHGGLPVWSKLNGRILNEIAASTNAAYIPAGTKRVNMVDVYHGYIANVEKSEFETAKINAYVPRFQWFAAVALVCLLVEAWLLSGRTARGIRSSVNTQRRSSDGVQAIAGGSSGTRRSRVKTAAAAIGLLIMTPTISIAQESVAKQINEANNLVRQSKANEAIEAFNQIDNVADGAIQQQLDYNLAVAHYRNADYPAAITLFGESAKSGDRQIAADSRFNIGNCHYAQALPQVEEQPDVAVEILEKAIKHFRSALRLDRTNADARANIELARKLIEQIRQQQKADDEQQDQNQDQQQGQDQNQDQENNDGQQNKDDRSSDQNEQSESEDGQKEQGEQGQEGDQSQQDKSSGEQESSEQQDSEGLDSNNQQSQRNNQSEQSSKDQPGEDQPGEDQPSGDESKEEQGTDEKGKQESTGELTSVNQQDQKPGDKEGTAMAPDREGKMTRDEALKLLQAVRDRDMLRRIQQQRRQRARRARVEKDW